MLSRFRSHIGGNVVGYLALFVALGGTSAYAAAQIGAGDIKDDAVLSRHIASGNVQSSDIGGEAVRSSDVKDNRLTGEDVNDGSITGSDVDEDTLFTGNFPKGVLLGRIENLGGAGTMFGTPSGTSTANATQESVQTVTPANQSTYADLRVRLASGSPLQAGESRTFTLEADSFPTVLSCTIGPGQEACSDDSKCVCLPPDSLLRFKVNSTGAGLNANDDAVFGLVASSP